MRASELLILTLKETPQDGDCFAPANAARWDDPTVGLGLYTGCHRA